MRGTFNFYCRCCVFALRVNWGQLPAINSNDDTKEASIVNWVK